jgi:hypothetical protein
MTKSNFAINGNDVFEVVKHLREHEQYQPELIQKKIKPWIAELEKFTKADSIESEEVHAEIEKIVSVIREAVMLGIKEVDASTYVGRYVEAKAKFFKGEGVPEQHSMVINDDESLRVYQDYQKKYMEAYNRFRQTQSEFAGYPLKSMNDNDYSPAERNILWAALAEYQSGNISVRLARRLMFRKSYGEPVSIYPSDHVHSVVSTLSNVYGLDVDGYLADMANIEAKSEAEREIEEAKLALGIKHKSEREVIGEAVRVYAKTLEPKN